MSPIRRFTGLAAAALIALAVWQLEAARAGVSMTEVLVGQTPATVYRQPDADGPAVVIAHGFAGSRQLMEAFALTLAHAGYTVVSFDFQGHGRNPVPMSADIKRIEGTTARLVAETAAVIDAATAIAAAPGQVAVLGHSMASDIIIRQAVEDERVAAAVAVSMYSQAVTAAVPERLLILSGQWEPGLRAVALEALRLVDPEAEEGETAQDPSGGILRRAVVAPLVEHVGVLYSRTSLEEARAWIDAAFGRKSRGPVAATGGWIALLLAGILLLGWTLAGLLPLAKDRPDTPDTRTFLAATLLPALLAPLLAVAIDLRFLPVLVADYLVVHLFLYGAISLAILYRRNVRFGRLALLPALALVAFGLGTFGLALDRYAASFLPHAGRIPVILAMAAGAVPFMLADSLLSEAGQARAWRRLFARAALVASLLLAMALDFERLLFLFIVLPVIILFFAVFGLMGGWVGRRTGAPTAPGLGLGLILAWALGVSFPLVSA